MNKKHRNKKQAAQLLQALYDQLPTLHCQGKCQAFCGVIPLFKVEINAISDAGHQPPCVGGHTHWGELTCAALTMGGKCGIYQHRPLICRIWGVTRATACAHGCVPDRWLSESEVESLLKTLKQLSGGKPAGVLVDGVLVNVNHR